MKILKYIIVAYFGLFLAACEKNDNVAELGESIGIAPNVYMDALDPTFFANTTVPVPIEYWLEGKSFGDFSMNHSIDSIASIEMDNVGNVGYFYTNEFEGEVLELEVYKNEFHDPAYWTPEIYVYSFDSQYSIDAGLAKKSYKDSDTSSEVLAALLSAEIWDDIYLNIVQGMNKSQFNQLLVVDNSIINEETLNSYYDESGNLTEIGAESLNLNLRQLPKSTIVGDDYKLDKKNRVALQYWIYSKSNVLGKSDFRSFIVK